MRNTNRSRGAGWQEFYWTYEMDVQELKGLVAELPVADARETAEIVRNWSNDKAFQIGMHVMRGNLLPAEASTALSNLAEASISTVLASVVADYVDRFGDAERGWSRRRFPGRSGQPGSMPRRLESICCSSMTASGPAKTNKYAVVSRRPWQTWRWTACCSPRSRPVRMPLLRCRFPNWPIMSEIRLRAKFPPSPGRAACSSMRVPISPTASTRRGARSWPNAARDESFLARLSGQTENRAETGVSAYARMRGGLNDVEKAARYLQLARGGSYLDDPAPSAAAVFDTAGAEPLAQAAIMWRDLQGVMRLVGEEGFDATAVGPKVKSLLANACGQEDFDALTSAVAETASRAAVRIDTLVPRA